MSLIYRFYVGDKRLSTAVMTKKGEFLQVYPSKKSFSSENAWREEWTYINKTRIETSVPEPPKHSAKKIPAEKPEEWAHSESLTFTAPAGTYYIGDLCYALSDKVYDEIFGKLGGYDPGLYQKKDSTDFFLLDHTAYGDGEYPSSDGKQFSVDAGIIGIAPMSLVAKSGRGGNFYTFNEPVTCEFKNGRFFFTSGYNEIVVDTTGDDDAY